MTNITIGERKNYTILELCKLLANENPEAMIHIIACTDEGHVIGNSQFTVIKNGDENIMLIAFNPKLEE